MSDFKQRVITCVLTSVFIIAAAGCQAGSTIKNTPSEINVKTQNDNSNPTSTNSFLYDQWQVNQVLFDRSEKSSIQGIHESINVPKYLGRLITIKPDTFSINTHDNPLCNEAAFTQNKSSAGELIAQSISIGVGSGRTLPQDIEFPITSETVIDVFYLTCQGVLQSKDRGMEVLADKSNATWLVPLPNDQIALSWHEQSVLILNRVSEDAIPSASFDCSNAGTTVEKTLCSNIGLAAYDKSLARAYHEARAYYQSKANATDGLNELKDTQREWIIERNKCGSDQDCLQKTMDIRIGDIIYDVNDYAYRHR